MKISRWMPLLVLVCVLIGLALAAGPDTLAQAQTGEGPGMIVFASDRTGNYEIFLLDPETGLTTQLTNDPATDIEPVWSPDGNTIAFVSDRDGDFEVYVMRADGSDVRQLTNNNSDERQPRWQPGGLFIVFASDVNGQWDLYSVSADGAIVRQLTNDLFDERGPGMAEGEVTPGPTPIVASPAPSMPDAVVESRQLNVRTNPGEGAQIITAVATGTALDIIGRRFDNTWLQVRLPDGRVGWVSARLVQVNIDLTTVPVVDAPFIAPPPTVIPSPTVTPSSTPLPVTLTPVPVTISFGVNQTSVVSGECVTLTWFVEGIKAVFYQGGGVVGSGSRQECPTETTTYKLTVILLDDTVTERTITVTVVEPTEEP